MLTKICLSCNIEKSLNDYRNHKRGKYGKESSCRACRNKYKIELLNRNPNYKARHKENNKKWRKNNKEYVKYQYREWKLKNKKYLEEYYKKYNANRGDRYKLYQKGKRLMKYWPELDWAECLIKYEELLELQNHSCAICKKHKSEFKNSLAVDHNHKTGKIRAALCYRCNRLYVGIHTLQTAKSVVEYLEKYDG